MDIFLDIYDLPKLNQEETNILNKPMALSEMEVVIKTFSTKNSPGPNGLSDKFYWIFKELMSVLFKLLHKIEDEVKF